MARAHAMDVRLNKHTNPTIAIAKANSVSCNESKILVTIECRVKSLSKRDQKQMDPSLGKWAKPWSKDTYLSGMYFIYLNILSSTNHLGR